MYCGVSRLVNGTSERKARQQCMDPEREQGVEKDTDRTDKTRVMRVLTSIFDELQDRGKWAWTQIIIAIGSSPMRWQIPNIIGR